MFIYIYITSCTFKICSAHLFCTHIFVTSDPICSKFHIGCQAITRPYVHTQCVSVKHSKLIYKGKIVSENQRNLMLKQGGDVTTLCDPNLGPDMRPLSCEVATLLPMHQHYSKTVHSASIYLTATNMQFLVGLAHFIM